jgi:peptide/nickel transport system substrate-binding protein
MLAVPADWGGSTGFPQNVTAIRAADPATVTMTMKRAYSPTWFLYNELSQVTPTPAAWDRTAQGPSACTTMVRDCAAVYHYLDAQARDQHSYVGSPLWSIVDGPWKLSSWRAMITRWTKPGPRLPATAPPRGARGAAAVTRPP